MFRESDLMPRAKVSSRVMLSISLVLTVFFLYLALRGLDWTAFAKAITNTDYRYLPLVFIWGSFNSFIRALRWRVLLSSEKNIPPQKVFLANMAGYFGNNILPARAGELLRAMYVGKANDIPVSFALATGFVERFVDLLALIIIGSFSLSSAGIIAAELETALKAMTVIALIGSAGILVIPYIGDKLVAMIPSVAWIKLPVREKIDLFLKQFIRGIGALHHPIRAGVFILFTGLIWLNDGLGMIILGRTLHQQITLIQALLLLASLGLSSAIPSTPGYIGVYQFVAVLVLTPFGISRPNVLAIITFMQITNFLIIGFWGGLAIIRPSLRARKAVQSSE